MREKTRRTKMGEVKKKLIKLVKLFFFLLVVSTVGTIFYLKSINTAEFSSLLNFAQDSEEGEALGDKAFLWDVSGGENFGNAKRIKAAKKNILIVEAELPAPGKNTFYQCWLQNKESGKLTSAGRLEGENKDFIFTLETKEDLSEYDSVVVSRESKMDENIEATILEGEFGKDLIIKADEVEKTV